MSRYKKIIGGELELPEIDGTKFVIYPTIETRMELLEHVKSTQVFDEIDEKDKDGKVIATKRVKGGHTSFPEVAKTCAKLIYEGCFEHDANGVRLKLKDEEKDTTYNQILDIVLHSEIMSIYVEILSATGIIDKAKAEKLKEGSETAAKN